MVVVVVFVVVTVVVVLVVVVGVVVAGVTGCRATSIGYAVRDYIKDLLEAGIKAGRPVHSIGSQIYGAGDGCVCGVAACRRLLDGCDIACYTAVIAIRNYYRPYFERCPDTTASCPHLNYCQLHRAVVGNAGRIVNGITQPILLGGEIGICATGCSIQYHA